MCTLVIRFDLANFPGSAPQMGTGRVIRRDPGREHRPACSPHKAWSSEVSPRNLPKFASRDNDPAATHTAEPGKLHLARRLTLLASATELRGRPDGSGRSRTMAMGWCRGVCGQTTIPEGRCDLLISSVTGVVIFLHEIEIFCSQIVWRAVWWLWSRRLNPLALRA